MDLGSAPTPLKYFPGSMCKRVFLPQNSSLCILHPLVSNNGSLSAAINKVAGAAREAKPLREGLCTGRAQQLCRISCPGLLVDAVHMDILKAHMLLFMQLQERWFATWLCSWPSGWRTSHNSRGARAGATHVGVTHSSFVVGLALYFLPFLCCTCKENTAEEIENFCCYFSIGKSLIVWLAFHFLLSIHHSLPVEILKPPPLIVVLLVIRRCKRVLSQEVLLGTSRS